MPLLLLISTVSSTFYSMLLKSINPIQHGRFGAVNGWEGVKKARFLKSVIDFPKDETWRSYTLTKYNPKTM